MSRSTVSVLVVIGVLLLLVWAAPDVLLVIFAGILLAVFLRGGSGWLARHTGLPDGWALLVFIAAILSTLTLVGVLAAPTIANQFDQLWQQVPEAAERLRERLEQYSWGRSLLDRLEPGRLFSAGGEVAGTASSALSTTFGAFGNLVIILFIGLYLAVDPGVYARGLKALFAPSIEPRAGEVLREVGATLRGWLLAQLLAMTIIGVLTTAGLWLLGVPLAPVLGLIAALLAFIPNIGPVLAAIPAVLLAFADGPMQALYVALLYAGIQTLESYFVTPLVQERTVSLPPALTLSAQFLLGVLFGILGLALATPLAAVGLTLTRTLYIGGYLRRDGRVSSRSPADDKT
jgi:predicted PurR-regulated permease PerM